MNPYAAPQTVQATTPLGIVTPELGPQLLPVIRGAGICYNALLLVVSLIVGALTLGILFMGLMSPVLGLVVLAGMIVASMMHLYGLSQMRQVPSDSAAGPLLTISLICFGISLALSITAQVLATSNADRTMLGWIQLGNLLCSTSSAITLLLGLKQLGDDIKAPKINFWIKLSFGCLAYTVLLVSLFVWTLLSDEFRQSIVSAVDADTAVTLSILLYLSLFLAAIMGLAFYATALKMIIQLSDTMKAMNAPVPKHLESSYSMPPSTDSRPQAESGSTFDFLNG